MLRAGLIRQLGAGIYSKLPLAERVARKVEAIVRQEMERIGGQEFRLPMLHPADPWKESGRFGSVGEELFRLKDRKQGDMVLAMTAEEIFTTLARDELRSYRQLPQIWYQIGDKFRDEPRPKSGVLRGREFTMKDSYSFDVDRAGLDAAFDKHADAYRRIFSRCGVETIPVQASSGSMGGSESVEFMAVCDAGEDWIVVCPGCGYAANLEKAVSVAETVTDPPAAGPVEKFPTPERAHDRGPRPLQGRRARRAPDQDARVHGGRRARALPPARRPRAERAEARRSGGWCEAAARAPRGVPRRARRAARQPRRGRRHPSPGVRRRGVARAARDDDRREPGRLPPATRRRLARPRAGGLRGSAQRARGRCLHAVRQAARAEEDHRDGPHLQARPALLRADARARADRRGQGDADRDGILRDRHRAHHGRRHRGAPRRRTGSSGRPRSRRSTSWSRR